MITPADASACDRFSAESDKPKPKAKTENTLARDGRLPYAEGAKSSPVPHSGAACPARNAVFGDISRPSRARHQIVIVRSPTSETISSGNVTPSNSEHTTT